MKKHSGKADEAGIEAQEFGRNETAKRAAASKPTKVGQADGSKK